MKCAGQTWLAVAWLLLPAVSCSVGQASDFAADLPGGVEAVWDLGKAVRQTTPTRERICLNGLWRWQPAQVEPDKAPRGSWGYFKVPGCWPGITDYMQKDCQTVHSHPSWRDERLARITAAWYEREFSIPDAWAGRRVALSLECLNSLAVVYIDGERAGELRFPDGELDFTKFVRPGQKQTLSLHVAALPLKGVLLSYNDSNSAREVKGSVARRGLCGDAYLVGSPAEARVTDVKVDTSVRKGEIAFDVALADLADDAQYSLQARITADGAEARDFSSPAFRGSDVREGRFTFSAGWKPDRLWDTHTPQNKCEVAVSLVDARSKTLDASFPVRFGYREFWIDGRDFYLNGSRIHLSAVPFDNAQVSAAAASYEGARESLQRLKSFGINFVYTHNYGCEPGSHLSFAEILRAADDVGMLVALSQPHFSHYDWRAADADRKNGYAQHAQSYVRTAQNHPAVVAYAMSHNACGYEEDMNPDLIDGLKDPRVNAYERDNAQRALRAEAIVRHLDPGRIVYHHAGGDLGAMHTINFYPNFVPIQEMSDWFEHWATKGAKPVFLCEYGAPFSWDWTMFRGWYNSERSFGSAEVPWDFCLAEWNAQFLGDAAFQTSELEKANLRWEAKQFKSGKPWHRWDYPHSPNSKLFDKREPILARYITANWRAFRTWGVSAISPWEHEQYWKLREGVNRGRKEASVDWLRLQQPGFSPDYLDQRYERMDLAYALADWAPTQAAEALLRNNLPLLAYIAGGPEAFTSQDHHYLAGDTVEKQAIVINDSRQTVACDCTWSLALPTPSKGSKRVEVQSGEQARVPLNFELPPSTPPGAYELRASFKFESGQTQEDTFLLHVLPTPPAPRLETKLALYDPQGETTAWLDRLGIRYQAVAADADLSGFELLVVGKGALTADGPAPDISRVRDGLRVLLFEQTSQVLEKRFGFRVAEYGLREVFRRVPDHPVLTGLTAEHLRDWRGAATILPPRLTYRVRPRYGPSVEWCGISVPRLWRCGNRGNVASVLIEKPARGDFRPLLDGGFSLQYSPLLEYREGRGLVLFCQLDVTGRTEPDPVAQTLAANILNYAAAWKPGPQRAAFFAGDPVGRAHLQAAGFSTDPYNGGPLTAEQILVVGPGGGKSLAKDVSNIAAWLKGGGNLLAIGLDKPELAEFLSLDVGLKTAEHISASFEPPGNDSLFCGVGPADVYNRDPRQLPLVTSGAAALGNGVLAKAEGSNVVFCQLAPWQFEPGKQQNLKKTFRRSSFVVTRLLSNMGAAGSTPLVSRFHSPADAKGSKSRWKEGLYLDQPEEWDDPYRHFRW